MKFKIGDLVEIEIHYRNIFGRIKKSYMPGTILLLSRQKVMVNTPQGVFWLHKKIVSKARIE